MNKNKKKRVNEFKLGDRIPGSGMHFVKRNVERQNEINTGQTYVDAACPFCGRVKEYRLGDLKNGRTTSCSCNKGKHGHFTYVPKRKEDSCGNITYDKGYEMNFGWIYDGEAGLDTYGNRMVNVHSKWVETDKAVMPLKELDPVENADGLMMYSRWAKSYIDANNVDLSELVTEEERKADELAVDFEKNPHKRVPVQFNEKTRIAHGKDEYWMLDMLSKHTDIATKMRWTAYVINNDVVRKDNQSIKDCDLTYADNTIVNVIDGKNIEIYEEYDGYCHSMKNPSERDSKVMFECAKNNKGLFRLSTQLNVFKERNKEAVLAIRKYAINIIEQNILHNYNVGYNEKPTIVRVSQQRGIEGAILKDGQFVWGKIEKISDFLRIHC